MDACRGLVVAGHTIATAGDRTRTGSGCRAGGSGRELSARARRGRTRTPSRPARSRRSRPRCRQPPAEGEAREDEGTSEAQRQRPPRVRSEDALLAGALGDLRVRVVLGPGIDAAGGDPEEEADEQREAAGEEERRGSHGLVPVGHDAVDDRQRDEEEHPGGEQRGLDLHVLALSVVMGRWVAGGRRPARAGGAITDPRRPAGPPLPVGVPDVGIRLCGVRVEIRAAADAGEQALVGGRDPCRRRFGVVQVERGALGADPRAAR